MESSRKTNEEMMKIINQRFENLYHKNQDDTVVPYVCCICDEFMPPRKNDTVITFETLIEKKTLLQPHSVFNLLSTLIDQYKCNSDILAINEEIGTLLLSPRSVYIPEKHGLVCCTFCKTTLSRSCIPKFAISNNYCIGQPPECLTRLTPIELSFLSPVKTYGYCFVYTGGAQKQLKGSLSFYKVKISSIARTAANFELVGLSENIVIILHGKMTDKQRRAARKKNKIRTNYILEAIQWLCIYNKQWREANINIRRIQQRFQNPVTIDNSTIVESDPEHSNIESTESFQVFFPDGTVCGPTGGQANIEKFRELVHASKTAGYDIEILANLSKEAVSDYKDDNLVNACLLQFPYGRGGINETRLNSDLSFSESVNVNDYIQHLSRVSSPNFHTDMFSLILYNMYMKQNMIRGASWQVRDKQKANRLATEFSTSEIHQAISSRKNGRYSNTNASELLKGIDAVSSQIPHSNQAAKSARRRAETFQHYFGISSYFLTVTPDDDNSYLLQIYSGLKIDDDTPIDLLTNNEIEQRAKKRTQLRINYPGLSAYVFEHLLDIIIYDVIGWDTTNKCPRENYVGLFGKPKAFIASMEEQGRRTIHTHMQIWIEGMNTLQENLYSRSQTQRRQAKRKIIQNINHLSSTSFFYNTVSDYQASHFPHDCNQHESRRKRPKIVNDEKLRELRHKHGHPMFAYCPHCTKSWTNAELVEDYLKNAVKVRNFQSYTDSNSSRRLKSLCLEYQKSENDGFIRPEIVGAAYNIHIHTFSCFGKDDSKKRKLEDMDLECRYRYPKRKKRKTCIENATNEPCAWFSWTGKSENRVFKDVLLKRKGADAFVNESCTAISQSKFTCNTNIQVVTPGPLAQYGIKYTIKKTQEEDLEEYEKVENIVGNVLSKTKHKDNDRKEGIRKVLAATFAHHKESVIGAALALHITRNKSQFMFSHKTVWCPHRDFKSVLQTNKIKTSVRIHKKTPYFESHAMHYLCRPTELDHLSSKDFYEQYEVVSTHTYNANSLMYFDNSVYVHPSFNEKYKYKYYQGVKQQEYKYLVQVMQYDFPDTASFNGNIMNEEIEINYNMETYSELALLLLQPFCTIDNLLLDESYTKKF